MKHNGYVLSPRWLRGFAMRWLRGSVAISRSVVTHEFTQPEGVRMIRAHRYGVTVKVYKFTIGLYGDWRVGVYAVPDQATELFLAVAAAKP